MVWARSWPPKTTPPGPDGEVLGPEAALTDRLEIQDPQQLFQPAHRVIFAQADGVVG